MDALTMPRAGSRRKTLKDETPKEIDTTAVAGANGPDANTLLVYLGKIEIEEAKVAAAKKRLAKVWKLAINDGIVRKDLALVRSFMDQDPDTVLQTISRLKSYAEWLDVPIGKQLSIFDVPTSSILKPDEQADKAYRAGFVLGITGKNPDSQAYPADHEWHQQHMEGWHAGQKMLLDRIGTIDMALDADPQATEHTPAATSSPAAAVEQGEAASHLTASPDMADPGDIPAFLDRRKHGP